MGHQPYGQVHALCMHNYCTTAAPHSSPCGRVAVPRLDLQPLNAVAPSEIVDHNVAADRDQVICGEEGGRRVEGEGDSRASGAFREGMIAKIS